MTIPGLGILKGLRQTARNYWAPKVTNQYPESRPTMPDRWRGRLDLIYDPFGEHKCEVCFQCAQVCPVEAIDMSGFDSSGNRIRYGLPEIYDERKDPNAYRRAGLSVETLILDGAGHGDKAFNSGEPAERVVTFLRRNIGR